MQKLFIDGRHCTKRKRRGIANVALNVVNGLTNSLNDFEIFLITDPEQNLTDLPIHGVKYIRLKSKNYIIQEQFEIPALLFSKQPSVFLALGNTFPLNMPRRTKLAVFLHDLIFMETQTTFNLSSLISAQKIYQKLGRFYTKFIVVNFTSSVDLFFTPTKYVKKKLCGNLEVDLKRIMVTGEGPSNFVLNSDRSKAKTRVAPYFLIFGAIDERKNTNFVVRNFCQWREDLDVNMFLFIIGIDEKTFVSINGAISDDDRKWIKFLGFVDEAALAEEFFHCQGLIFASSDEGFGIPVLDAIYCKIPILAANASCTPEVAGACAVYFEIDDVVSFQHGLTKLAQLTVSAELEGTYNLTKDYYTWSKAVETVSVGIHSL